MDNNGLPPGFALDQTEPSTPGVPHGFTLDEDKYGGPLEQGKAALEGAAQGLLGPIAPAIERGLGVKPEDIQGRAEANPWTHGLSEAAGLVVPGVLSGGAAPAFTQAGLLARAGEAGAAALGLGAEGASIASKVGSKAVAGAIENSLFTAGDVGSQIVLGADPSSAVQSAVPYLGLSAVIGGAVGAGLGAVPALWTAAHGSDTAGVLRAVMRKMGGQESSVIADDVTKALDIVGVQPKPDVVAAMASDPAIQRMSKALEQSDVTATGEAHQAALKDFNSRMEGAVASSFGKTPEELSALPELSKYEAGKSIGQTLSDEYKGKLDPTIKEFEYLKDKYKNVPLVKDSMVPDLAGSSMYERAPDVKIPGTASQINEKLAVLANHEGWIGADSDISRELNRVMKEIPKKESLGELTGLITQIGNNTKSTLPFGMQTPLSRAGSLIKNVLRDAEDALAVQHLGAEAPELVSRFRAAQQAYKAQAGLKDALNERLKIGGSVTGFVKGLKEMAQTDGEGILSRLSGKNDANLLEFLNQNFPATAQKIKDHHLSQILETAVNKAKPGEALNLGSLQQAIGKMSPELRQFVVPQQTLNKLEGIQVLQDALHRLPHNFSNTARTAALLDKYGLGTAVGMASMLTGHGPVANALAAALAHGLSKSIPDAGRLALLKFLGSSQPVNSVAMKGMADFIHASMKGAAVAGQATKAIFQTGAKVLPDSLIPTPKSRKSLEDAIEYASNPDNALNIGRHVSHYLPDHATATAALSANAMNYLKALKPTQVQKTPLDKPQPVDKIKEAEYQRALDIAEQPLMALQYAKEGSLRTQDVQTLNAIYPSLHGQLVKQTYDHMAKHIADGHEVSYAKRQSLSLLMGSPLDSTMTQPSMMNIMMANAGARSNSQQQHEAKPTSKLTSSAMEKTNKMYATPNQARAASRLKG